MKNTLMKISKVAINSLFFFLKKGLTVEFRKKMWIQFSTPRIAYEKKTLLFLNSAQKLSIYML